MTENEFLLALVGTLDKKKSTKQVNANIKELEKVLRNLRLTATLAKGESKKSLNLAIKQLEGQLRHIKLQAKFDQKNLKNDVDKALQNISFKDIDLGVDTGKTKLKVQKAIADVKKTIQSTPISLNIDLKKEKLKNQLTSYLSKNSKIRESEGLLKEADQLREKIAGINDRDSLRNATDSFQLFRSECSALGYQAKSSSDRIRNLIGNVTKIGSALGVASLAVSNFQKSLKTIRENDSTITEISKTSNMTKEQLTELGNESFDIASKYGRLSQDLLLGVQEMARSGYENASKEMAELSLMAQSAGDMTADVANAYIIATDNAYKYHGSIQKLNEVLDGQNSISNRNSVALQDMAEGMSKAGTVASSYNVAIEDLSAMIGTIEAVTKSGGSEVGNAIKSILINLQNVTSKKIVNTLDKANASITEMVDGAEKLRNPIAILKDLAKTFNKLDEDDPLRAEILTNVGGKYQASKLGALLQNMDMFDKMLVDYSEGSGSALEEANKSANDLAGTLNRLQNSWDELINSITNKSAIKSGVGFFDGILQSVTKIVDAVDVIPVALAGVTAFMTAKNKDMGLHILNNEGKFDLSGNFMGIVDVDQIKHYKAASEAVDGWNQKLARGVTDIESFQNATVQNTAQLKEYLKTCSVDAPASLKGYKQSLQAAGEATNSLRLGTILLNTALSLGLGLVIQSVISLVTKAAQRTEDLCAKASELGNEFSGTSSDIDSYKSRIEQLQETINDSGASIEDVTNARKELMSIQAELINKYGRETEKVNAITEAINGQVSALERLKKAEWYDTKTNYNAKTIDDHVLDFVTKTIPYVFEKVMLLGDDGKMEMPKTRLEETLGQWEAQSYSLKSTGNTKLDELLSKSFSMPLVDGKFQLAGSVDDLKEKLGAIKEVVAGYELPADFQESLSDVSEDVQLIYESTSNIRSQSILYDKIMSDDPANAYDEAYEKLERLKAAYDEVALGGDTDRVNNAVESYAGALSEAMQLAKDQGDFDVAGYFESMYPELQQAVGEWRFNIDFNANTNGLEKRIRESINALQDFSIEDIGQFNVDIATDAQIQAYGALKQAAINYGLSVGQLVSLLEQMGLVQSENYQKLVSLFGEDNIKKLTPDELTIAYKIENTGNMTFGELQDAIAQAQQAAEEVKPTSFKEAWKSLDNVDSGSELKDLKENLLELAKQGKLTIAEFNKTTGARSWLKEVGLDADEAVEKINKLASSADQLASMGKGIKALSDNLATKKESPKKAVDYDTLAGMSDELKECTAAWQKYEKVMGTASSTYEECRNATNNLATAFINSNNFLVNLTDSTKDYYISQLKAMGVSNAEAIVTAMLAQKHREAAEAKQIEKIESEVLIITKNGVTNETLKEVDALFKQEGASRSVKYAIVDLVAQEQILANTSLGVDSKIQQLNMLAETYYGAAAAASFMNQVQTSADGALSGGEVTSPEQAWTNITKDALKKAKKKAKKQAKLNIPKISVSPINYSTPKPSSSSSDKGISTKAKESTQVIDWIGRKLDVLQDKIDLTKAKFENLFAIKKQKNNLTKQIKQITTLLNNQQKAIAKYQKKANSIKLPKSLKSKVQNGAITGKVSALIKEYGEDTAKKITDYQDYIDKIKDLKKAAQEAKKAVRELKEERNQLYIDRADSKLSMLDAKAEVALNAKGIKSAEATNKVLQKKIKWTKQYYNYQIKNAKLEKDSIKVMELQAQKKKALLDIKARKQQNLSDEAEANISRIDAKAEIARDSEGNQSAEETNKLLQEKIKYTKQYYNHQIKAAKLEGDSIKAAELQAQKEKEVLNIQIEKQQNLADEAEAKYNLNQQYETNAASAKDKNKYESESLSYLKTQYNKLIKIAELEGNVTEQKRLQAEKQEKINESYQAMYDNIKTEYDNKTALNDADISIVRSRIETLEAAGKTISESMYEGLMKMYSNRHETLLDEYARLKEAGKDFEYGSDAWYKWQTDLLAAGQGLEECTQETINLQKAINELDFKKFTLMAAQLDATKSHLDFLVDMLSHKDLTSKESGGLTDEGMATISLRFAGIENYKETIKNAQADLDKLYEDHQNGIDGLTEEEFLEKREEQLDIIRQSTETIADEKDAIIDLVEDALQLQIDSINELIEKKKKALATEKDLYEYQRKIAKQTKNIALIQKQIAALSGDKSEEARASIQKLQLNLEEAQEDLKDTEYDKWHSDQEDMLDNLADEVEDFWEKVMDDLKKNLDTSLDNIEKMISENPDAVARALDELGLGDALSIITTYNPDGTHTNKATDYNGNTYESTYDETGENVKNQFKIDKNPAEEIVASNEGVKDTLDEISNTSSDIKDEIMDMVHNGVGDKFSSNGGKDLKDEIMDMVNSGKGDKIPSLSILDSGVEDNGITLKSNKPSNSLTTMVGKLLDSALHKPKTDAEKKRMEADPLLKYLSKNYSGRTISKANEAKLGAMLGIPVNKDNITEEKAKQIKNALKNAGFAKGGIAETIKEVTLENGDEGIITIQKGEAVLDKEQTEIMQRLAERGLELAEPQYKLTDEQVRHFKESVGLIDYSDMLPKFDIPASNTVNTSINIGDVNVHLDGSGVVDPKSFCDTFRRSNEMQRAVQDATIGQVKKSYAQTLIL